MRAFRLAVPVSDVSQSSRFYESVLGVKADDTVPTRVYFHCGGFIVALVRGEGSSPPLPDNLYLSTDELDAVYDRAVAAGAEVTSGIDVRPWHERSFYCLDPDGNPLCFVDDTTVFLGQGAPWSCGDAVTPRDVDIEVGPAPPRRRAADRTVPRRRMVCRRGSAVSLESVTCGWVRPSPCVPPDSGGF